MNQPIHIFESLRPGDFQLGEDLHNGVLRSYQQKTFHRIGSEAELIDEIDKITPNKDGVIVHLVCHADQDRIATYDQYGVQTIIPYDHLYDTFRRLFLGCNRLLTLVFCACEGLYVAKLVARLKPCPYYAVVGPSSPITIGCAKQSFDMIYPFVLSDYPLQDAVNLSRGHVLGSTLKYYSAEAIFSLTTLGYLDRESTPQELQRRYQSGLQELQTGMAKRGLTVNQMQLDLLRKTYSAQGSLDHMQKYREAFFK